MEDLGIQGYANFFTGSAYEGSVMMTVFGYDPTNTQPSFNLNAPRDNSTVVHEIDIIYTLHHTFKGDGDADNNGIGDACPGDVTIGVIVMDVQIQNFIKGILANVNLDSLMIVPSLFLGTILLKTLCLTLLAKID